MKKFRLSRLFKPVDPCIFEVEEVHHNVTVEVLRCKRTGRREIIWYAKEE
jgi:hypothetical protein